MQCSNSLKNISLALQNYHDTYRTFPAAYVPDKDGEPMHSWRVLILPYIEERNLYDKYDFTEPWDGPNNSKLLADMPSKDVMIGMALGSMNAPATNFVRTLSEIPSSFVRVLGSIQRQKEAA